MENKASEMNKEDILPVKKGDWIQDISGRVATVKDAYWSDGEVVVDLYLYDDDGNKTGRESPVMGGPRTFEPACSWEFWHRITKPIFPAQTVWLPNKDGGHTLGKTFGAKQLPDRQYIKRKRKPKAVSVAVMNASMIDEVAKLRFAAAEFKDMHRQNQDPDLLKRAHELEAEADRIER